MPGRATTRTAPTRLSLVGNPIADPERPLEVLRTILDPCIACAVHMLNPAGREMVKIKVM